MRSTLIAALAALAAVAACTTAPEPVSYILEAEARPVGAVSGPALGLREVDLPLYARRSQIATLGARGEITLSDFHLWAEEQPRAVSRLVARSLAAALGRPVAVEPWPPGVAPEGLVDVDVDVLIGSLGGEVRLGGEYRVIAPDGRMAAASGFEIVEPLRDDSYGALVAGHADALGALADRVAADMAAAGL